MQSYFKKNILTILIITSLSSTVSAETANSNQSKVIVNADGSFTIPSYDEITAEFINQKIEDLKNEDLIKFTTSQNDEESDEIKVSPSNKYEYIPMINEKNITENTFFRIDSVPADFHGRFYGGSNDKGNVTNTNVLFSGKNFKGFIYGANSKDGDAKGNVYINNGELSTTSGAYSIGGNAEGNLYLAGKTVINGGSNVRLYGAVGDYIKFKGYGSKVAGNVYILGETIINEYNEVYGAYVGAVHGTDLNISAEGNVFITGGTMLHSRVWGARSTHGNIVGNVFITGGTVDARIVGAQVYTTYSRGQTPRVEGNVYLSGGTIGCDDEDHNYDDTITGASNADGTAVGNVYITGETIIKSDIYGAGGSKGSEGNIYFFGDLKQTKYKGVYGGVGTWGGGREIFERFQSI